MGLRSSIVLHVKQQNLGKALQWLENNSWDNGEPIQVQISGKVYNIRGDHPETKINNVTQKASINCELNDIDMLTYSTSLVFDIDPKIIKSEGDWSLEYSNNLLPDFIERFQTIYLGNGKIRIGGFDTFITRLEKHGLFRIAFCAVTSDMSIMLEESFSVRKWITEISTACNAELSFVDREWKGDHILWYKGAGVDIKVRDPSWESKEKLSSFFTDYFNWQYNSD